MNPSTERALDRLLEQMSRTPRRRTGFSTAPLSLGLGLLLGYQLLVRLVPMVWSTTLPGGLAQARALRGWPGLMYRVAETCYNNVLGATLIIAGAVLVAFLLCRIARPLRWLVWAAAVAVILIDAGIVILTLRTALLATAHDAGLPM